jgi:2'-5' RNA ligase
MEAVMAEGKRLFLALWPDQSLQETLYSLARRLQKTQGGRRTRKENIHLTLVFLGQVHADKEMELRNRLRQVEAAPFELVIDKSGSFAQARVNWVGPSLQPRSLKGLYNAIRMIAQDVGYRGDNRGFTPHITLLRKSSETVVHDIRPLSWQVNSFYLIESVQTRAGVHYQVVEEFKLTEEQAEDVSV